MDETSSAKFRTSYAKLTRPTVVTVNGHPIGTWVPVDTRIDDKLIPSRFRSDLGVPDAPSDGATGWMGDFSGSIAPSFNSRPFRPVPKRR